MRRLVLKRGFGSVFFLLLWFTTEISSFACFCFVIYFWWRGLFFSCDIDTYSSMTPTWHCGVVVFCVAERATRATPSSNRLFSTAALRCCCCRRYSSDCHCCSTYPHSDSLRWCSPSNCCWFSGSLGSQRCPSRTTMARISQKSAAIGRNQWQSLRLTVMISFVDAPVEWQMAFH